MMFDTIDMVNGALHKAGCSRAGLMFGASIPG
jgi:hypothetical protein